MPNDAFCKDVYNHAEAHLQRAALYLFNPTNPLRAKLLREEPDFNIEVEIGHAAWGLATLLTYLELGYIDPDKETRIGDLTEADLLRLANDMASHVDEDIEFQVSAPSPSPIEDAQAEILAEATTFAPHAILTLDDPQPNLPSPQENGVDRIKRLFNIQ